MKVEQIYTGCLAEAAYYIESDGEAAIVDPLRETAPYLEKAKKDGAQIKYILETHFHADFVSGHLDLANKSGATIVFGPTAAPHYKAHIARDGEELKLGKVTIKVLHTPGHTMESATYLLINEQGENEAIFTGDTLFINDVGRPDLAVKTDLSREDLAAHLYDSLRDKIMPLEDKVIVYPGHGAGSACGKNMSKETTDTLGHQKMVNYALRADMTKAEFIREVTTGLVTPPQYFPKNAVLNKMGYQSFDTVLEKGLVALFPEAFEALVNQTQALMLDTRSPQAFKEAHIPNSIFIGLDGSFASWVGTLITDLQQPMVVIAEPGREEEAITRLSRVGYDNTLGYLQGGLAAWKKAGKAVDTVAQITAAEFAQRYNSGQKMQVLDVRRESEYKAEHIVGVENFPLDFINNNMDKIDRGETYYLHCAGGYRSMVTASILKARGYEQVVDIAGGFKAMAEAGVPKTDYVAPITQL